ncbi:MAG TPA: cupin domain-containing protein [Herpetosiphonaceae bacterium]|nr:cupin domain-containing protein [Herpetosiphonaceae bacterium]
MFTPIQSATLPATPGGAVKFEGEAYGSPVSFFHVNAAPGSGSALHVHPYPETWIVRIGSVSFTVGDSEIEARSGDILVGPPNVPHRFINTGTERLEMVCIHASPRIIQQAVPA